MGIESIVNGSTESEAEKPAERPAATESELDVELSMDLPDHDYASLMQHYR